MSSVGIIAEYNPFHNGHAYQLSEIKHAASVEHIIVVMSGSFVQRGEPACADKFTRAEWALRSGADIVIALPDALSCACAQRFAECGIKLLKASGIADSLCFGSESGDIEKLRSIAGAEPRNEVLTDSLAKGLSYPAALAKSLELSESDSEPILPNDILGIEYLRAVNKFAPDFGTFTVKRVGAAHNETDIDSPASEFSFSSASSIRTAFSGYGNEAPEKIKKYVPSFVYEDIKRLSSAGRFPADLSGLSDTILYLFRTMEPERIAALADVSEGLENVFRRAAYEAKNVSELLSKVKTKRYTLARLRRICVNALLGTTEELQKTALDAPDALYIHVLGVKKEKINLLSELKHSSSLPVVTKFSDAAGLCENAEKLMEHSRRASAIRSLANPAFKNAADDFSHPLIIV